MNIAITTDPTLLNVNSTTSLTTSPSVSTFLPEEDASTCPLLPCTPSPPPMDFIHPLTPSTGNDEITNELGGCIGDDDGSRGETSSSGSSSGIGMDIPVAGTTSLFNNNVYHHLGKNLEMGQNAANSKQLEILNIQITKDTPNFVYWNWPLIRKFAFLFFGAWIVAVTGVVITMIITMPKYCDPITPWHKGSVFFEIFPASFHDSSGDGIGDFTGIVNQIDYLKQLGIDGVRLNSIFMAKHYPDHFEEVSTLFEIDTVFGGTDDLIYLVNALHKNNITIILDLPIYPLCQRLDIIHENDANDNYLINANQSLYSTKLLGCNNNNDTVTADIYRAIKLWTSYGIDGFYVKGLEYFANDPYLLDNIIKWKEFIGTNKILIVDKSLFDNINDTLYLNLLKYIDLIDVYIDTTNGTRYIADQINNTISKFMLSSMSLGNQIPTIHWSLGGVSRNRLANTGPIDLNVSLSLTLMELLLPGIPSIFYGDEISLKKLHDKFGDHIEITPKHHLPSMPWNNVPQVPNRILKWIPEGTAIFQYFDYISNMISLRKRSPSIYQNFITKLDSIESNTLIRYTDDDILIIERRYPRRNTFASISNFNRKHLILDLTTYFYSGEILIGETKNEKIFFSEFIVGPMETIIVKLDK